MMIDGNTAGGRKAAEQRAYGSGATGEARPAPAKIAANAKERTSGAGADGAFAMMDQFTRALGEIGLPDMFDFAALSAAYRRNMEAVSAATRVSVQGAERVARCEIEMMQQIMTDLSEAMRLLMSAETPMARAAHWAELSRRTSERAVASLREVNELVRNSQREAFDLLNQCALATMAEVQDTFAKNEHRREHA